MPRGLVLAFCSSAVAETTRNGRLDALWQRSRFSRILTPFRRVCAAKCQYNQPWHCQSFSPGFLHGHIFPTLVTMSKHKTVYPNVVASKQCLVMSRIARDCPRMSLYPYSYPWPAPSIYHHWIAWIVCSNPRHIIPQCLPLAHVTKINVPDPLFT
jgi:hypothetical protein